MLFVYFSGAVYKLFVTVCILSQSMIIVDIVCIDISVDNRSRNINNKISAKHSALCESSCFPSIGI